MWADGSTSPATANVLPEVGSDTFKLIFADTSLTSITDKYVKAYSAIAPGAYIKFQYSSASDVSAKAYKIVNVSHGAYPSGITNVNGQILTITLDRNFDDDNFSGSNPTAAELDKIQSFSVNKNYADHEFISSTNPAIFETEPVELADLELYYEASDPIAIADIDSDQNLDFFNVYSFGNGVESNRIEDDFNAAIIGNGVRVNSTIDKPYSEERRSTGLIYSGIFNSRSGVNNTNQFLIAEKITKDLNPAHGSIQKLHARDADLIALCEDKCFRILADKDALFNADGNINVTSTNRVLGQSMPYSGEFGISKNPETFATYGFRAYFTDKSRGTVIRLSRDGITEIADKGMSDYFEDKFKSHSGAIIGSYDEASGSYNVSFSDDESVAFKEKVDGWTTRLSFTPDFAISLNNEYYTIRSGELWEHSNTTRSNFYGVQKDTKVTLLINDAPSSIKNFKTLTYEGDAGWTATIDTDQQDGAISSWQKREGFYYNFISGKATTVSNMDTSELAVQGLGEINGAAAYSSPGYSLILDGEINVSLQVGDTIYKDVSGTITSLGVVSGIANNRITTTSDDEGTVADNTFIFFVKDTEKNTSGLVGYYGETTMTTSSGDKKELFAVNAEVFISSE